MYFPTSRPLFFASSSLLKYIRIQWCSPDSNIARLARYFQVPNVDFALVMLLNSNEVLSKMRIAIRRTLLYMEVC